MVISGVWVHLFLMTGKSPLFGLSSHLFLFWFVPFLCLICVSLLHLLAVLVLFPNAQKGSYVCFGVWCPLLSAGGVSVLLWRFASKNLIGLVQSGKPLGLFFLCYAALCTGLGSQAFDGEAGTMKPVPGMGNSGRILTALVVRSGF